MNSFLNSLGAFFADPLTGEVIKGIGETFYMVLMSTLVSYVIGLPLGVVLVVTDKDGIHPMKILNSVLGTIVNILRSVPFVILVIVLIPFTRAVVGTFMGNTAAIVPLVIGAFPFIARVVESSIKEVDKGVIEAAQSMGASNFQIIYKVLIPEAVPSLIMGAAIAITTILSYTAMAGMVGAGGLGKLAISYGYHRYNKPVMLVTVVLLVVIVQTFQEIGMGLTRKVDKKK